MERGFLTMNQKERKKLEILSKVKDGNLTLKEASHTLGISYRQIDVFSKDIILKEIQALFIKVEERFLTDPKIQN
jgi:hypothetical protein